MRTTVRPRSIAIPILLLFAALVVYGLQREVGDERAHRPAGGEAIAGERSGGVGPRVAPATALSVDRKVDAEARPRVVLSPIPPSPSSTETEIRFALERRSPVDVSVFDAQGREVAVLARDRWFEAGTHRLVWRDGTTPEGASPPGFYFIRLRADGGEWKRPLVRLP